MEGFSVVSLNGLVLPKTSLLKRDFSRPVERQDADYLAKYDQHTIAYDHWIDRNHLYIVSPRLLNLWQAIKSGQNLQRKKFLRWELLKMRSTGSATLKVADIKFPLNPGPALTSTFDGLRVLMTVSKNNPLDWIKDWATFHVRAQGAEALLFFDNGSSLYEPEQIVDCLSRVRGLKRVIVATAPFPYGPAHGRTKKLEVPSLFFQTAILNLARLRMLGKAKSVLNVDIDEMVLPNGNKTVFEAAERSLLGVVRIAGSWIYCGDPGGHRLQSEHDHRPAFTRTSTPKWCVSPSRLAGKVGWTVHRVFGDMDSLWQTKDNHFVHCQQNCTGWKVDRVGEEAGLILDPMLIDYWKKFID